MALPSGEIEEKYELVTKLSEGGMGAIYKVRHRLLDEIRVIKVIRPQQAGDRNLKHRFRREARTAIQLRHPNIAEIYDFSIDAQGVACIVMEFIDGIDLKQMLERGGPPALSLTMEVAVQALRALGFLHQRGFVHRDISPDNIMVTSDHAGLPLAKLIDLGIAKRLGGNEARALTATGMFIGKVQYAAPEQFQHQMESTPRSDLYAFGVLLYEVLTGHCPIAGNGITELIASHVLYPPRPFEETDPQGRVPAGLRAAVLRALEKKSVERHSDANAFADALAPFRGSEDLGESLATTMALRVEDHQPFDPDAVSRVSELLSGARLLVGQQEFEDARDVLNQALAINPRSSEASRLLGTVDDMLKLRAEAEQQGRITRTAEAIGELIDSGQLESAEEQLQEAIADLGEAALFRDLQSRLREAREAEARRLEIAGHIANARRLAEAGKLDAAERALGEALALDPEAEDASRILADVRDARRQLKALRRRELASRVAKIKRLLDADDPDGAAKLLAKTSTAHAGAPELKTLEDQIEVVRLRLEQERAAREEDERREKERQEKAQREKERREKAQREAESRERQANEQREREARERAEAREAREQHTRAVEVARKTIERHLERGELADARHALDAANTALGTGPVWETLERRIDRAETEARLAEATRRISLALDAGDLDRARRDVEAIEIDDLAPLRERLEAEENRARSSRAQELLVEARGLLAKGQHDDAEDLLEIVLAIEPEHLGIRELRDEVARQQREVIESQHRALKDEVRLIRTQDLLDRARHQLGQGETREAVACLEELLGNEPDHTEARALLAQLETGEQRQASDGTTRRPPLALAIAAAMVLVAILGWWLAGRTGPEPRIETPPVVPSKEPTIERGTADVERPVAPPTADVELETPKPQPEPEPELPDKSPIPGEETAEEAAEPKPVPDPGTVVIDARPWAEVVALANADGRSVLDRLSGRHTPVTGTLPPGRYRLSLAYTGSTETLDIEVISGRLSRVSQRFEEVDADALFRAMGW